MLREAYPGAVYYYMARPYRVSRMDIRNGTLAVRRERYWTTKPIGNTMVFPRFNGGAHNLYGAGDGFWVEAEVQVSERVLGFQEMRGGTKLGPHKYGPASPWCRRELTRFFGTTGVCWHLADRAACSEELAWRVLQAFCLDYGVQGRDLGVGLFHAKQTPFGPVDKCQGVCIYDAVDGSLRLTQRLAENFVGVLKSAATYVRAEGAQEIADQLLVAYNAFASMAPVQLANGRMVERPFIGDWAEVIAAGERAIYLSEDGPREVTVIGHRFTPKGLMYDLVPEKDAENSRWTVSHRVLQLMHGFTRTVWVDLVTGEERRTLLAEPPVQAGGALYASTEFGKVLKDDGGNTGWPEFHNG
jgi:DEAD/DEAH box helicase domain-containing protein